jgi:predicted neuraminidase
LHITYTNERKTIIYWQVEIEWANCLLQN